MSFDAVGNVAALSTTLPAGTDHQLFCYDDLNRLTWAGTSTGNPCGNPAPTGTFSGADYTQTFAYDTLDRVTSNSALGSYTYGDSAHLHAATSTSFGYSATYDAAGNITCRAPTMRTTCYGERPQYPQTPNTPQPARKFVTARQRARRQVSAAAILPVVVAMRHAFGTPVPEIPAR